MIFGPTLGILGHWFKKKRGLALGLCAVGSSIGGTVFPIASRTLIKRVGYGHPFLWFIYADARCTRFPWTMRILGFILILVLGLANIVLDRRLPPKNVSGGLFNLRAFKSAPFSIYCLSGFVAFLGLYTGNVLSFQIALFTLTSYNIWFSINLPWHQRGISRHFPWFFVLPLVYRERKFRVWSICYGLYDWQIWYASINWRSCVHLLNSLSPLGAVNVIAPMTIIAAVMTYAWPFARTKASLIAIAVLYG